MALERRNPLPKGLYWQDIFSKDQEAFDRWLTNARLFKAVEVVRSETIASEPRRTWVLFRVLDPIRWDGPGFPTIAESEDLTAADTGQKPDVPQGPNLEDVLESRASSITSLAKGAMWLAGGALTLKILDTIFSKRKG